jgi:CBS domain-containing protein
MRESNVHTFFFGDQRPKAYALLFGTCVSQLVAVLIARNASDDAYVVVSLLAFFPSVGAFALVRPFLQRVRERRVAWRVRGQVDSDDITETLFKNDYEGVQGSRHVRDVMKINPAAVSARDSVREAARIMHDQHTGVVPVVDGKKVIGMITDRDIVVRAIAEGKNANDARVSEVMTKQVRTVNEAASVEEALELMSDARIRRVAVVNQEDELVGIVSIGDLSPNTTTLQDFSTLNAPRPDRPRKPRSEH